MNNRPETTAKKMSKLSLSDIVFLCGAICLVLLTVFAPAVK